MPGTYSITVTRSNTVTSALVVTGIDNGVVTLSPSFLPTTFSYTATVPFKVTQLAGTATFGAGTTDFYLGAGLIQALTTNSISTSYASLAIGGANIINFIQSDDGQCHARATASTGQRVRDESSRVRELLTHVAVAACLLLLQARTS
jgi:hypothetical protein